MWLLALETTTPHGSVALLRDDVVVAEGPGDPTLSHAEHLPADVAAVLAVAGLPPSALDLFAVATGPGGFTGLRIALAAVQGLALSLDRPVAGVPSLSALAWAALEQHPALSHAGVWLDASRGEVFAAAYRRAPALASGDAWPLEVMAPPTSASPGDTLGAWHGVILAGTSIVAACRESAQAALIGAGHRPLAAPTQLAGTVGRIAWRMHALGLSSAPHALMPEYVRRPDVEIDRDRRAAAARAR